MVGHLEYRGRLPGGDGWKRDLRGRSRSCPHGDLGEGRTSVCKSRRDTIRFALSEVRAGCWGATTGGRKISLSGGLNTERSEFEKRLEGRRLQWPNS